jgi:predicted membrane protein
MKKKGQKDRKWVGTCKNYTVQWEKIKIFSGTGECKISEPFSE